MASISAMNSGLPRGGAGDPLAQVGLDLFGESTQSTASATRGPSGERHSAAMWAGAPRARDGPCRGAGSGRRSRAARRARSRSRNVSSPHWMSSNTTISGRSEAACSSVLRNAQAISSGEDVASVSPRRARDRLRRSLVRWRRTELLQHLDGRPVRDALAVRQAASSHDCRVERREGLGRRAATCRRRLRRRRSPARSGARPEPAPRPLGGSPSSRARPTKRMSWRRSGASRTPRRRYAATRSGFALELQRLDGLDLDGVADQMQGRLPDQHLAWWGRLLQSCSDVDRVTGRQPLLGSGHDLAGRHADSPLEAQLWKRVAHLGRRATPHAGRRPRARRERRTRP